MSETSVSSTSSSSIPPPPSKLPTPTGNLLTDSLQSATRIGDVPCARNSLLNGIASGVGIGIVRGLSAGALVAGHWGMATFVVISLGSYHLCRNQMANERKAVTRIMENMPPRRVVDKESGGPSNPTPSP